jgi:hypothetical protein
MPKKTETAETANVPALVAEQASALALAGELGLEFNATESVDYISLVKISISRETCMFGIPNAEGELVFAPEISGNIIFVTNAKSWWPTKYGDGEAGRPHCFAVGSHIPDPQSEDMQSNNCLKCPMRKINGKLFNPGNFPSCNEKKRILLLREDAHLPYMLDVPALGIQACNFFLTTWQNAKGNGPLPLAKVTIGLRPKQSKTSDQAGTEPVFTVTGAVTEMERALEIKAAIDTFGDMARRADTFSQDDGGNGGSGNGGNAGAQQMFDENGDEIPF